MSSEILRGARVAEAEPLPWMVVAGDPPGDPPMHPVHEAPSPAVEDAEARVAAMQAAADRAIHEARDAGRREGELAARQAAHAEVQRAIQELGAALRQVSDHRPHLRQEAEADLVRLALAIARRVVRRELSIDPEAIAGLARTAIERLRLHETVCVRMHPQFEAAVRQFLGRTPGASHIEIAGDPTLDRGAIVFETARGRLYASAETQFDEIERGLTDRLRGNGA